MDRKSIYVGVRKQIMKKCLIYFTVFIFVISLIGCGGNVSDVKVTEYQSETFTEKEIESAIEAAKEYFQKEFKGCTLTEITYAGDEKTADHAQWAERIGGDEVIVLLSSFKVDSSGGDGSLNLNSTYTNWMWILARSNGGKWEHVDHGY